MKDQRYRLKCSSLSNKTVVVWAGSSVGRALRSQRRGRVFDPPPVQKICKINKLE